MKRVLDADDQQDIEGLFHEDESAILHQVGRLRRALVRLQYEGKFSFGKNLKEIRGIADFFDAEVEGHMDEEEATLFPFLETHLPRLGPLIALLHSEHQDFKNTLAQFKGWLMELEQAKNGRGRAFLTSIDQLKETGIYLICLLEEHHREESQILYKVADRELREDEKRELEKRLLQRKGED